MDNSCASLCKVICGVVLVVFEEDRLITDATAITFGISFRSAYTSFYEISLDVYIAVLI